MWPHRVVEVDVLAEKATQVPLVHHDHVVQTLSAERAHDPLGDGVRLRGAERRQDRLDPDAARVRDELPTELGIPIADQVPGVLSPGRASRICRRTQGAVGWRVTFQ